MREFGKRSKYFPSARCVTCIGTSNWNNPLVTKPLSRLCIWNCACRACKHRSNYALGKQEWRGDESTRLPPMWPGFESWCWRHIWVEFVVGSLLCSERFFSGYSGFPLSSQPTLPDSNSTRNQLGEEPLSRCATSKIVIYLFICQRSKQCSQTPCYGHLIITDNLLYPWEKNARTFSLNSTHLIWTPHYYRQFALSLGKESLYIFSQFNPLNTDTLLLRTVCFVPGERKPIHFL